MIVIHVVPLHTFSPKMLQTREIEKEKRKNYIIDWIDDEWNVMIAHIRY